mmetsp:Transcript_18920/g.47251  ORF Transcript_18920/g.47251 Transcript_18920/m.47251 type:complete len:303 (+) Transcript_18920:1806-2714(+)
MGRTILLHAPRPSHPARRYENLPFEGRVRVLRVRVRPTSRSQARPRAAALHRVRPPTNHSPACSSGSTCSTTALLPPPCPRGLAQRLANCPLPSVASCSTCRWSPPPALRPSRRLLPLAMPTRPMAVSSAVCVQPSRSARTWSWTRPPLPLRRSETCSRLLREYSPPPLAAAPRFPRRRPSSSCQPAAPAVEPASSPRAPLAAPPPVPTGRPAVRSTEPKSEACPPGRCGYPGLPRRPSPSACPRRAPPRVRARGSTRTRWAPSLPARAGERAHSLPEATPIPSPRLQTRRAPLPRERAARR